MCKTLVICTKIDYIKLLIPIIHIICIIERFIIGTVKVCERLKVFSLSQLTCLDAFISKLCVIL